MKLITHTDYSIIKNEIGKNQIYEVEIAIPSDVKLKKNLMRIIYVELLKTMKRFWNLSSEKLRHQLRCAQGGKGGMKSVNEVNLQMHGDSNY